MIAWSLREFEGVDERQGEKEVLGGHVPELFRSDGHLYTRRRDYDVGRMEEK